MFVSFPAFGDKLNLLKLVLIPNYMALQAEQKIRKQTLAAHGLEELFFQLCCCVSFWFWREIGFDFT
jgi:hypothetical protein